ncbi:acetylcholinesterase [Magnaporthiopsis poae ATCC 64411]|uniref:Carboxylic ester hydrolase n=1 Tax=Magnaporthiopsis poae (strain ATCC 64411 / 73-15) TaxID=644358 RepID=A0A0C4E7C1_MAGP6|nr:acetylcholinesterase [Magnaporthiopsis poae ATCC 64411]
MKLKTFRALAAIAALAGRCLALPGACTTVHTKNGIINGFTDSSAAPGVVQFLGIPYGEAPVGDRRWLPALPRRPFDAPLDALAQGPSCPQTDPPITGRAWSAEFLIRPGSPGEDCLYLNVWAPLGASEKSLPVVVWIHGGGFTEGGGDVAYQIPAKWVQRSQKHIVVGINYRLGLFGFPNAAGLDPKEQNLGLLDQRLGIEWVRDNIAQFGGDPSRIILWGQSAGAVSVSYYQYAFAEDPIAIGFIKNSGSPFISVAVSDPTHSNFSALAAGFGCTKEDELNCLRKIPFREIQEYRVKAQLSFGIVVDEKMVFSNYPERTLAGKIAQGPAITGTTRNEGVIPGNPGPLPANATVPGDSRYGCPAHFEASLRGAAGLTTWRYMYSANFTNIMPGGQGAFHSADLPLFFGTHDIARGQSTPFEYELSNVMQDLYLAFIEDPAAGLTKKGWEPTPPGPLGTIQTGVDLGHNGVLIQKGMAAWTTPPICWSGDYRLATIPSARLRATISHPSAPKQTLQAPRSLPGNRTGYKVRASVPLRSGRPRQHDKVSGPPSAIETASPSPRDMRKMASGLHSTSVAGGAVFTADDPCGAPRPTILKI